MGVRTRLHDRIKWPARMSQTIALSSRATLPIFNAAEVESAWRDSIEEARGRFALIERLPMESVSPESVLDAWDAANIILEDAFGPISLLNSVHPDGGVRDAGDRALIEESVFLPAL